MSTVRLERVGAGRGRVRGEVESAGWVRGLEGVRVLAGVEFLGDEGVGGSGESGCVAVGELSVRRWHGLCVP